MTSIDAKTNATARVLLSILRRELPRDNPLEYTARKLRATAYRLVHSTATDAAQTYEAELYALALELAEQVRKAGG